MFRDFIKDVTYLSPDCDDLLQLQRFLVPGFILAIFEKCQKCNEQLTQPAITCSKLTIETRCEICSKLTIKRPERRH